MPATTLKELARRAAVRNIRRLDDIGDIPVTLVNNIISRIDNFPQLQRLEQNSPQVIGSPGVREAYLTVLKRDIPNLDARLPADWHELFGPDSDASRWHKIYTKLKRAVDKEREASNARMASALDGLRKEATQTIDIVDKKPRGISVKAASWNLNKDMYGKGSGLGFFEKMNRNASAKKRAGMRTPTHKLASIQRTPVFRAPLSLVEDAKARKAVEEENKKVLVGEKRKREEIVVGKGPLHAPGAMKEREERLKRLKSGQAEKKDEPVVSRLTVEDLEGSDEDDGHDDLFGENTLKTNTLKTQRTPQKPVMRASSPMKTASPPTLTGKPVVRRRQEATLFRPVKR